MIVKKIPKWTKTIECPNCTTVFKVSSKEAFRHNLVSDYPSWHMYVYCPFCTKQLYVDIREFFKEEKEIYKKENNENEK